MDENKKNMLVENLTVLATPEGMQKYLFGTKNNGQPRAVYDIVKDFTKTGKKKKKKNKNKNNGSYSFYIDTKKPKKKKKNKKKVEYWHI